MVEYEKDDTLSVDYDYAMILLHEENNVPLKNITLLAGLAVNTSPASDFMFGNRELRWGDSPLFIEQYHFEY